MLLPGGNLPLNIFEPRYLQMVRDAMQTDRVIGMIQPQGRTRPTGMPPELYRTGCAGRITNFAETDDGRLPDHAHRRLPLRRRRGAGRSPHPTGRSWPTSPAGATTCSRRRRRGELKVELVAVLRAYFDRHGIEADWEAIEQRAAGGLVTSLCMICPFEPAEKQALLEAGDATRQARLLIALMEMERWPSPAAPARAIDAAGDCRRTPR